MYRNYLLHRRKLIVILAMALIFTCLLCFVFTPKAYAEDEQDSESPFIEGSQEDVLQKEMYDLFHLTLSNQTVSDVTEIMLGTNSGFYDALVGSENSLGNLVLKVLKTFAASLLLLYSLIAIVQAYEKGHATLDFFYKILLKMTISFVLIVVLEPLLDGIQQLGYGLVTLVNDAASSALPTIEFGEAMNDIKKGIEAGIVAQTSDPTTVGTMKSINALTYSIMEIQSFCNPILLLLEVAIKTVSYSFFIEMAIRKAFMPIAVINIAEEGVRSPAVHYLKKYLAVYIKMMICILAVACAYAITTHTSQRVAADDWSELTRGFSFFYDTFAIKAAALVFIRQGSSLADDIIGV